MESTLMDTMYELPSRQDVDICRVTKRTITQGSKPDMIMKDIEKDEKKKDQVS